MILVLFYEKPGCATNRKQKKLLQNSGCTLIVHNLLEHGMTREELLSYLENEPVEKWFNPNAPKVKKGEIDPFGFTQNEALELLFSEPILIRRPLLSVQGERMCGFNVERIEKKIGTVLEETPGEACSSEPDTSCNTKS